MLKHCGVLSETCDFDVAVKVYVYILCKVYILWQHIKELPKSEVAPLLWIFPKLKETKNIKANLKDYDDITFFEACENAPNNLLI